MTVQLLNQCIDRWTRFWFSFSSPEPLACCRILVFAWLTYLYGGRDYSAWGEIPDLFWLPTYFFDRFNIPPISSESLSVLQMAWKISLFTAMLGVATRLSTFTAFLLSFYLIGLPHNFGKTHHADTVVPLVLLILACSRCGDAFSIDRVLRSVWPFRVSPPELSGAYTWPIRMVWVLYGLVFFAAGYAKVYNHGLAWMFSDNMQNILLLHYYSGHHPPTNLGLFLASHPVLYKSVAVGAVAVEILSPLVVFSRWARSVLVPATFLMLAGFKLTFNFTPLPFFILAVFFVPWEKLMPRSANGI